jgi:hypothetical protein
MVIVVASQIGPENFPLPLAPSIFDEVRGHYVKDQHILEVVGLYASSVVDAVHLVEAEVCWTGLFVMEELEEER